MDALHVSVKGDLLNLSFFALGMHTSDVPIGCRMIHFADLATN